MTLLALGSGDSGSSSVSGSIERFRSPFCWDDDKLSLLVVSLLLLLPLLLTLELDPEVFPRVELVVTIGIDAPTG